MATIAENFKSFFRDLFSDLKSSRRFQVATVLWIPLIVVGFILFIRFSIRNELHEKYREWGTTFIPQSAIQYPDVRLSFANPNISSLTCKTVIPPMAPVQTSNCMWPPNTPEGRSNFPCRQIKLSAITATNSQGQMGNFFGNPIACNFTFGANPGQNEEMYLHTPGGWGSQSWSFPPQFIRPNQFISVHLEKQMFVPEHQAPVTVWNTQVNYDTSIFPQGNVAYNTTIFFRIPFGALQVAWERVGFDSYFLMAAWGGGFFFFYFLHICVFSILKLFLPNDSKLLKVSQSSEYTPLK
eukprot:TRINITY_DN7_c0_g2_i1.p1 TRINITY_DN7_c0_g2~~TRINITY_DN7_c0_g2_i1.p1  ORF type:complete len:338 (+),score=84.15 TRINITY_DN7_c0_g2_i1:127-1014(+)